MTVTPEDLLDYAQEVKTMRDLQKEYFKARDKTVLGNSKSQEKKVDGMTNNIIWNLTNNPQKT